jgi:hypothetical protein
MDANGEAQADSDHNDPLYTAFLTGLPISGASIAVFDRDGHQSTIWASNSVAGELEALQFDLGEGPHWLTLATAEPVMINDVRGDSHQRWPAFGEAVQRLDVGAMFAFPVCLGAVTIGVVDLYKKNAGTLSQRDYAFAITLSGRVAKRAIRDAVRGAYDEDSGIDGGPAAMRRELHQATGVVLVHLGVTATEAFFILRGYAYSHGLTLLSVAHDVLNGRIDFRELAD